MDNDIAKAMNQRLSRDELNNKIDGSSGGFVDDDPFNNGSTTGFGGEPTGFGSLNDDFSDDVFGGGLNIKELSQEPSGFDDFTNTTPKNKTKPQNGVKDDEDPLLTLTPTRKSKEKIEQSKSNFSNYKSTKPTTKVEEYEDDEYEEVEEKEVDNKSTSNSNAKTGKSSKSKKSSNKEIEDDDGENSSPKSNSKIDNIKDKSQKLFKSTKDTVIVIIFILVLIVFCWHLLVSAFHTAMNPNYDDSKNPAVSTYRNFLGKGN